jgi:hypothetical protein
MSFPKFFLELSSFPILVLFICLVLACVVVNIASGWTHCAAVAEMNYNTSLS